MAARSTILGALALLAAAAAAPFAPSWIVSLSTIAFANGLVVLGLLVLARAGLVPFGQALFYAIGAYGLALLGQRFRITDALALTLVAGAIGGLAAWTVGFLLARYRDIFFAMLSLALSMILYGVLVKTEALGSTDGFNIAPATLIGFAPKGHSLVLMLYWLTLAFCAVGAVLVSRYLQTVAGSLGVPIRENEIRIEYLGLSVTRLVHFKLVIAGTLASCGGALAAMTISHVDPTMAYWTTSGEFVFVMILAGPGSVAAAFIGALLFSFVRSVAVDVMPGTWQILLGAVLLLTILFLPAGVGGLFARRRRRVLVEGR